MSKYRQAAKIDINQPDIVKDLRAQGCTVETGKDDILVAHPRVQPPQTLWVEIKTMDTFKRSGGLKADTLKDSQVGLIKDWAGWYMVAWTSEQIMGELKSRFAKVSK